tara:strand:- start:171 stop:356 length:186 start_codon:yes stop_codon:yes gene_type:complete
LEKSGITGDDEAEREDGAATEGVVLPLDGFAAATPRFCLFVVEESSAMRDFPGTVVFVFPL